jgi:exodeoxyribonuclease-1
VKKIRQIGAEEAKQRAQAIRDDKKFQERVGRALSLRYADEKSSAHVEQKIYDGFPEKANEALMQRFHHADWDERVTIAGEIADERLMKFAYRLIFFERPDCLPDLKSSEIKKWRAERMLTQDDDVPWMTIPKALREADKLLNEAAEEDMRLLQETKQFLSDLADQVGPL